MKRRLTILFALAACTLFIASQAFAITACGKEALNGMYGYQLSGVTGDKNVPLAGYGWVLFDGTGKIADSYMMVVTGGQKAEVENSQGTYTVSSDCTVTFKIDDANTGASSNFAGAILAKGDDIAFTQTDDGAALTGIAQKTMRSCPGFDLVGSFGFRAYSSDGTGALVVGQLVPHGGNADVTEWVFSGGKSNKFTATGTYKVNNDCTVTVKIDAAEAKKAKAEALSFKGLLIHKGKDILMITDKGVMGDFLSQ